MPPKKVKRIDVKSTLEAATVSAGGVRALARALDWNPGAVMKMRSDEKVSPYRHAQIARLHQKSMLSAVVEALHDGAKSDGELVFWSDFPKDLASEVAQAAALVQQALSQRWDEIGDKPSQDIQLAMLKSALEQELLERWALQEGSAEKIQPRKRAANE